MDMLKINKDKVLLLPDNESRIIIIITGNIIQTYCNGRKYVSNVNYDLDFIKTRLIMAGYRILPDSIDSLFLLKTF